jgi:hypothetical protein
MAGPDLGGTEIKTFVINDAFDVPLPPIFASSRATRQEDSKKVQDC